MLGVRREDRHLHGGPRARGRTGRVRFSQERLPQRPQPVDKEAFYAELKWIQRKKGHRSGWCWHQYQARFKGERPPKWFEILEPRQPSLTTMNWMKSRADRVRKEEVA